MKHRLTAVWPLLLLVVLNVACAGPTTPMPTASRPTADPFLATRGGEPRSAGYWLQWNSCTPDNRSETARANGGRETGWIIVDDLLQDPGILLGELAVETCSEAVSLLQRQDLSGTNQADDPVYQLATQLLTAQLNLASSAESCPAAEQAVQAGQLLLLSLDFQGTGTYLTSPVSAPSRDTAAELAATLAQYNTGALCVP